MIKVKCKSCGEAIGWSDKEVEVYCGSCALKM